MHKILITDPAGVVISTKHHAQGEILKSVPPGIAKALVHFKQGRDIGTTTNIVTTGEVGGGSPQEDFTRKLKALLVGTHDLEEDDAEDLIKANTHLVALGALSGDVALDPTAIALLRAGYEPGGGGGVIASPHPASRLVMVPGAPPTPGGSVIVPNQPTANLTGSVAVGGGAVATAVPGATADGGADRPSQLQEATAAAETAEVKAAAEGNLGSGSKKKSGK